MRCCRSRAQRCTPGRSRATLPPGGACLAICLELASLPVLADLYLWPAATAAVPAGGRVLYARTDLPRSDLQFMTLLDRHRSADATGVDPHHPATGLLLVQLAAKYLAAATTAAGMASTSRCSSG